MDKKDKVFDKLQDLLKLERKEISAVYFYAISGGLIQLSLPLGIQAMIGFVLGATRVASVYVLIFFIVLGVLLVGLLQINQMKIIEKIQQKIFVRFAIDFAEKIPNIDLQEIDEYYLPEKINRFFDIQNIQKGFSKILLDIPLASIQIVFGLILLSLYHPLFIVFSVILLATLVLIFKITGKQGIKTSLAESDYKYSVVAWLEEMGRVIKSFKYSQGTNLNLIKTDANLHKYVLARTDHFKVLLFQFQSLIFFKVSLTALMLILGSYLLFEQKINIGQFVAAEIVILAIISALEKLVVSLENIYDVVTGLKKAYSILDIPSESGGTIPFQARELKIDLEHLSFSYMDGIYVINDLTLSIPAKSLVSVSGAENSGKSTLLKLLTGNYSNFKGAIIFNDIPILNYSLQSLRSQTGIILSEQDIFNGTVYENIALGKTSITVEEIMKLAKKMNIQNFILNFPKSFDTMIDPIGEKLPSSIIRKILLLRALIHQPTLIILEEPWLGLDDITKMSIQNYLFDLAKSKTIIVSSNNSVFASRCDIQIDISTNAIKTNSR